MKQARLFLALLGLISLLCGGLAAAAGLYWLTMADRPVAAAAQSTPSGAAEAPALNPTATPEAARAVTDSPPAVPTDAEQPAGGIDDPTLVLTPPPLTPPPANAPFSDPVFGTRLTRLLDGAGFSTHTYSQLQAFSPDGQFVLLIEDGVYTVRRLADMAPMPVDSSGWNAPRWHPLEPHTVIHFDSNADTTVRLQGTDGATGQSGTRFTFPPIYEYVRVAPSQEELSRDGRWAAAMLTRGDGETALVAVDLQTGTLTVEMTIADLYAGPCAPDPQWGSVEPDWIGVSPLGNYLVVQWTRDGTARCSGLETFDLQSGAFTGRPYDGHQHGDLGLLADGVTEIFMTFELYHPSGSLAIGYRPLPGAATVSEPVYLTVMDWHGAHISCQGPAGVCLVTSDAFPDNGWSPLEGELFLQYTDGRVLRLAHHRSSSCDYWVQPRASLSADGRRLIFASDWDGCGPGDAYVVDLYGAGPLDNEIFLPSTP